MLILAFRVWLCPGRLGLLASWGFCFLFKAVYHHGNCLGCSGGDGLREVAGGKSGVKLASHLGTEVPVQAVKAALQCKWEPKMQVAGGGGRE